jgi:hypothetical protein
MEEAYSREEVSAGWWPSSEAFGPIFYAYAYPEPAGYREARIRPTGAAFDEQFGEYVLPYDVVREADDPDGAVYEFLQSVYEAGADLGRWDRRALEPEVQPGRPPRSAWSVMDGRPGKASHHRHSRGTRKHLIGS